MENSIEGKEDLVLAIRNMSEGITSAYFNAKKEYKRGYVDALHEIGEFLDISIDTVEDLKAWALRRGVIADKIPEEIVKKMNGLVERPQEETKQRPPIVPGVVDPQQQPPPQQEPQPKLEKPLEALPVENPKTPKASLELMGRVREDALESAEEEVEPERKTRKRK